MSRRRDAGAPRIREVGLVAGCIASPKPEIRSPKEVPNPPSSLELHSLSLKKRTASLAFTVTVFWSATIVILLLTGNQIAPGERSVLDSRINPVALVGQERVVLPAEEAICRMGIKGDRR